MPIIIAAAVLGVGLLIGVAALVYALGSDDDSSADRGPNSTSSVTPGVTPDSTNTGSDTGSGDDRAREVAQIQIFGASSSTVDCIAGVLQSNTALMSVLETMPATGVSFADAGQADQYASMISGCATNNELVSVFTPAMQSLWSLTPNQISCLQTDMSFWGAADWHEFILWNTLPARSGDLQQLLIEVRLSC